MSSSSSSTDAGDPFPQTPVTPSSTTGISTSGTATADTTIPLGGFTIPPSTNTSHAATSTSANTLGNVPPALPSQSSIMASLSSTVAVQTSAVTSFPTSVNSTTSKGVSPGAVAGIAIATAIIGAAIAFGVAFCFFKRKQRDTRRAVTFDSMPDYSPVGHSKDAEMSHIPPPALSGATPSVIPAVSKSEVNMADLSASSDFLAGILPPAADESTIKEKANVLFDQVQLHIENFYRDVHATMTQGVESDLNAFQSGLGAMVANASRPTIALKHALMAYVLRITGPKSDAGGRERSVFPANIVGVGHEGDFVRSQAISPAYIIYRRLSAYLYSSLSPSSTSTPQSRSAIAAAADHFSSTFFPWADPSFGDEEKDEHLCQVISNALDFQIWLYGQPFIYEFMWNDSMGRRGVVVAPGLRKISDKRGRVDRGGSEMGSLRGRGGGQVLLGPVVVPV